MINTPGRLNALVALCCLAACCAAAGPATRPAGDLEATWLSRDSGNILGGHTDHSLRIAPATQPGIASVTMSLEIHPPPAVRNPRPLRTYTAGPYPATYDADTLVVRHPAGEARYSFAFVGANLLLPGFVRKGDREIVLESSEFLAVDAERQTLPLRPLTVYRWQWVFSVPPESAGHGTGHYVATVTPDPNRESAAFDFDWEWQHDRWYGDKVVVMRRHDKGPPTEGGAFFWAKGGYAAYRPASGEDGVGPGRKTTRGYSRLLGPASAPTTRP